MIDAAVRDEVARLYPGNVSSELENNVRRDIIDWILNATVPLSGMDMKDVIKMFWNERLN
jgi:hypothetical protein